MSLSMLLACPVESAWKCGTNTIVFPGSWSKGQADWPVMLRLQLTWCWSRVSMWSAVWSFVSDLKVWIVCREAPHLIKKETYSCESRDPIQLWAHMRKEGRGDWQTRTESQLRNWDYGNFWPSSLWETVESSRGLLYFFWHIAQDLEESCCETAISKAWISSAALPTCDILQAFYATKEGNGNRKKCLWSAVFIWLRHCQSRILTPYFSLLCNHALHYLRITLAIPKMNIGFSLWMTVLMTSFCAAVPSKYL